MNLLNLIGIYYNSFYNSPTLSLNPSILFTTNEAIFYLNTL